MRGREKGEGGQSPSPLGIETREEERQNKGAKALLQPTTTVSSNLLWEEAEALRLKRG